MVTPERIIAYRDKLKTVDRLVLCRPGREDAIRELLHFEAFGGRLAVEPSDLVEGNEVFVISRLEMADGEG